MATPACPCPIWPLRRRRGAPAPESWHPCDMAVGGCPVSDDTGRTPLPDIGATRPCARSARRDRTRHRCKLPNVCVSLGTGAELAAVALAGRTPGDVLLALAWEIRSACAYVNETIRPLQDLLPRTTTSSGLSSDTNPPRPSHPRTTSHRQQASVYRQHGTGGPRPDHRWRGCVRQKEA